MTGAEIIVKTLIDNGVRVVFGYPGGSVLPLYDELYKYRDQIPHVIAAHEQGAAHAADGYARVTGETGVVIATSGPGATNIVTGIANAYLDSVPMVAITGNVATPLLGRDSFQEVDIVGITMPIVKHSYIIRDLSKLEATIHEAFHLAQSGRRGPVLIDVPRDMQTGECDYLAIHPFLPDEPNPIDPAALAESVRLISASCRPYIYVGGGVVSADAGELVQELSRRLNAPIGCSMMGLSSVPADFPLNLGMTGMHGTFAASLAQDASDCLLAIGVRFSDRATGDKDEYRRGRKIIQIDVDPAEINKNIPVDIELLGNLRVSLRELLSALPENNSAAQSASAREWQQTIDDLRVRQRELWRDDCEELTPRNLLAAVNSFAPDDAIIATDVGQHQMWTAQFYPFKQPRTFLTSGGLGTMGFGLGAAIGGAVAARCRGKNSPTILFTGDGSFGMNLNELATAVSQNLPLLIVVMNNGVLGMVRQWQTAFYGKRYSQTTLNRRTDFVKLAEAFGARGKKINSIAELKETLAQIFPLQSPVLLDCAIDADERVLPMIPPGRSVKDIIVN